MSTTEARSAACPKCGFDRIHDARECARCGVVFRKLESLEPDVAGATTVALPAADPEPVPRLGRSEARMLAFALVGAAVANALPVVRTVLGALATLFHEFGHAVVSWLLGHPAIPAFDFAYGGGFTHEDNFKPLLAILIGGGWLGLGWVFRRNPRTVVLVGLGAALWLVAVSSEWRREVVIASVGHGGELILAATFVFMALSGVGWSIPEVERPLGAFLGCFVQIHTMHFAWKLGHDAEFLAWYREGKGGALMNDLESVALDLHIHTGIAFTVEDLAGFLLVLAVISFAVALALVAFRGRLRVVAATLLDTR